MTLRTQGSFRRRGRQWTVAGSVTALIAGLALGGCDLAVTNPASIEDEKLDKDGIIPTSLFQSIINGARGDFAVAASGRAGPGGLFTAGALLTDELVYAGTDESLAGFSLGRAEDHWKAVDELWALSSRARFTAEQGVARMAKSIPDPSDPEFSSEALYLTIGQVWAGYINRVMGDNFCHAVIDGGPRQDHTEFYTRAEKYFTDAIATATATESRSAKAYLDDAYAGRAQVRLMLGDWAGAVADAGQVETKASQQVFHSYVYDETNNYQHKLTRVEPELTVWGTPFAQWGQRKGTATGDSRVVFEKLSKLPTGEDGRRPHLAQARYTSGSSGTLVFRGTEMRLIEAEALLVAGQWQAALDKINEVRTYRKRAKASAVDADDAWGLLMKERGLELWLEGRRLPDMRRWARTPGFVPFDVVREAGAGDPSTDPRHNVLESMRDRCIPISRYERISNPNL